MPETLCIAELQDGRRALVYSNPEENLARLVLILRPEDMEPKPYQRAQTTFPPRPIPLFDRETGLLVGFVVQETGINIPPKKEPRITTDDLLSGAQNLEKPAESHEDQILREIREITGEDPGTTV